MAGLRGKVWPVLEEGRCGPEIYQVFPLARAAEAHRLMESSAHIGENHAASGLRAGPRSQARDGRGCSTASYGAFHDDCGSHRIRTGIYGPRNPGIQSQLPSRLQPLATIYRPENVFRSYEQVRELRDLTGLEFDELVVFRPERLVVHEVLIRVTGELTVPDGSEVDDLGVSFRTTV